MEITLNHAGGDEMIQNMKIGGDCEHGYPVGHMCPECDRKAELITPTANTKEIAKKYAKEGFNCHSGHPERRLCSHANSDLANLIQSAITEALAEKEREVEQLKLCLEPGKASAIVNGMFKLAEELGHPGGSSIHALTYLRRLIEQLNQQLTAERERTAKLEKLFNESLNGNRELAFDREQLGQMVREIWIRWAQTQPNPKPHWLTPWENLNEPDKEVDRLIGEEMARWTIVGDSAMRSQMSEQALAPEKEKQ